MRYFSFGGGVQSMAVLVLAAESLFYQGGKQALEQLIKLLEDNP